MAENKGKFSKENQPDPAKKRGPKKKTLIRQAIGAKGWEALSDFINNKGAEKYITELKKLKGASYSIAYTAVAEYVKPKLQRTTIAGDPKAPITLSQDLTFEQLKELAGDD